MSTKDKANLSETRTNMEPAARDHDLPSADNLFFRLKPLSGSSLKSDVLSGITVALMLIPEAIAFAFVAGVDPVIGLFSAFFIGLITAVGGGRPGMISGATGAMAVVVIPLVAQYGIGYLFLAVILCGLIQVAVGCLRLGKLIRMVPHSVMLGFVNGLAIVIGWAQVKSFKVLDADGKLEFMTGAPMMWMISMVILTMAICFLLPKLTKAVPASLVAIVVVALIALGVNSRVEEGGQKQMLTVKDFLVQGQQEKAVTEAGRAKTNEALTVAQAAMPVALGLEIADSAGAPVEAPLADGERQQALASVDASKVSMEGKFPSLIFVASMREALPPLNWQTLLIIAPFAFILAGVGLIESLMTLTLVDEITETRGSGNRECVGQGAANILCGLFGGMGGCAMIGQSLINVKAGGRGRMGIVAAVGLLLFVMFLAPWVEMIPMAALVGVMMMVVIGTFEWATLNTWRKLPKSDIAVMLVVTGITVVMHNLALAVLIGVIVSALVFAWQHATHLVAERTEEEDGATTAYHLHGPLFFASVTDFKSLFTPELDTQNVVIDFYYTRVYDQSGLEAINFIASRYRDAGKEIRLRHLSPECQRILEKAGSLVEIDLTGDPHYHVASDAIDDERSSIEGPPMIAGS